MTFGFVDRRSIQLSYGRGWLGSQLAILRMLPGSHACPSLAEIVFDDREVDPPGRVDLVEGREDLQLHVVALEV